MVSETEAQFLLDWHQMKYTIHFSFIFSFQQSDWQGEAVHTVLYLHCHHPLASFDTNNGSRPKVQYQVPIYFQRLLIGFKYIYIFFYNDVCSFITDWHHRGFNNAFYLYCLCARCTLHKDSWSGVVLALVSLLDLYLHGRNSQPVCVCVPCHIFIKVGVSRQKYSARSSHLLSIKSINNKVIRAKNSYQTNISQNYNRETR